MPSGIKKLIVCYNNTVQQPFLDAVWSYYHDHGRDLPWRHAEPSGLFDPYKILVSEVMLQQTQVARVITKYHEFLQAFPSVQDLASASLGDVLRLWQGLGYNRRAKFLWQAAQMVVQEFGGQFPQSQQELTRLPGVGTNTAGAICAYAYDQPVVFIETNIRTVYIHHFFADRDDVHDKELVPLVTESLQQVMASKQSPQEFYWALMDYGTHLKSTVGNRTRSSKHYAKQSAFVGSRRQVRGQVLRHLAAGPASQTVLGKNIADERLDSVLDDLLGEGLIVRRGQLLSLA